MNLKYFYWFYENKISIDFCQKIIKHGKEKNVILGRTGDFSGKKVLSEEDQEKQKQTEKPNDSFRALLIEFFELNDNASDEKIQSEMTKTGQEVFTGLKQVVMLNIIVSTKNYASFIRNVIYQNSSLTKIWTTKNLPTSSETISGEEYDFTQQVDFESPDFQGLRDSFEDINISGYR